MLCCFHFLIQIQNSRFERCQVLRCGWFLCWHVEPGLLFAGSRSENFSALVLLRLLVLLSLCLILRLLRLVYCLCFVVAIIGFAGHFVVAFVVMTLRFW